MYFDRRSAVHETLTRLAKNLDELNVDYAIAGAISAKVGRRAKVRS
jgi:hypothetical protein